MGSARCTISRLGGQGHAHTNWDNTQVNGDIHVGYFFTKIPLLFSRHFAALATK
jgi:hypothetical protein